MRISSRETGHLGELESSTNDYSYTCRLRKLAKLGRTTNKNKRNSFVIRHCWTNLRSFEPSFSLLANLTSFSLKKSSFNPKHNHYKHHRHRYRNCHRCRYPRSHPSPYHRHYQQHHRHHHPCRRHRYRCEIHCHHDLQHCPDNVPLLFNLHNSLKLSSNVPVLL